MGDVGTFFVELGSKLDTKNIDRFTDRMNELEKKNKNLFKGFQKAGAVMTGFAVGGVALMSKLTKATGIQEQAEIKLAQAMKTANTYTEEAFERQQEYASQLQQVTRYGDEAILSAQSLLVAFGAEGEMLEKLTSATLDLAEAKGIDLKSAFDLVGKSIGSSTNALTRYGVEIEGASGSTERMQMAVDNISKLFGGAAQAQAQTYLGRLEQLQNRFGDLQEQMGQYIIPVFEDLISTANNVLTFFQDMPEDTQKTTAQFLIFGTAISGVAGTLSLMVGFLPQILTGIAQMGTAFNTLKTFLLGHPIFAVSTAILTISKALQMYYDNQRKINKQIAEQDITYKTLLQTVEKNIERIKEEMKNTKLSREEQEKLREQLKNQWQVRDDLIKKIEENNKKKKDIAEKEINIERNKTEKLINFSEKTLQQRIENITKYSNMSLGFQRMVLTEMLNNYSNFSQEYQTISNAIMSIDEKRFSRQIELATMVQNEFTTGFGRAFELMFHSGKEAADKLDETFRNMGRVFLETVGQMISRWLFFQALTGIANMGLLPTGMLKFFPTFQHGGIVPGAIGQKRLAVVEGGERIMTPAQQEQGAQGGKTIIENLNIPVNIEELSDANLEHFVNRIAETVKNETTAGVNLSKATNIIGTKNEGDAF